ncbi:MAG: NAD(P)-binding protein [Alphaproteobacteria bacterium]
MSLFTKKLSPCLKATILASLALVIPQAPLNATTLTTDLPSPYAQGHAKPQHTYRIVGAGMAGFVAAYRAYKKSLEDGIPVRIVLYEKNAHLTETTGANIFYSLTPDELLSVIPQGQDLPKKLNIPFNEPEGIFVPDIPETSQTPMAKKFIQEVLALDAGEHEKRTEFLLSLGKYSMDAWQRLFDEADSDFKNIMLQANYHGCREPKNLVRQRHDGYRIDLISKVDDAHERAESMAKTYKKLGYTSTSLLSPAEVAELDPSLESFCLENAAAPDLSAWNKSAAALWRPGGCLDGRVFFQGLEKYLSEKMGHYKGKHETLKNRFKIKYAHEVDSLLWENKGQNYVIKGLHFSNGRTKERDALVTHYRFNPGENVGLLTQLGFTEPAFAGFAGPSLCLRIKLSHEEQARDAGFNHYMEVHQKGVVLAWQGRVIGDILQLGVAGTKAFYGTHKPSINDAFAKDRHLLQANIINQTVPHIMRLAFKSDQFMEKELVWEDLMPLVDEGVLTLWIGTRAVVCHGGPVLGALYKDGLVVEGASVVNSLGSGGGSFAPGCVEIADYSVSTGRTQSPNPFFEQILKMSDSRFSSQTARHYKIGAEEESFS